MSSFRASAGIREEETTSLFFQPEKMAPIRVKRQDASPDEIVKIKHLIARLAEIREYDKNLARRSSELPFFPISEISLTYKIKIFPSETVDSSPIRELVTMGPRALPFLLDALEGDPTLFLRADEVEASWRFADAILRNWAAPGAGPCLEYPAGSWGPAEAEALFHGCEGGWSRG
jgi:hypothetical protein